MIDINVIFGALNRSGAKNSSAAFELGKKPLIIHLETLEIKCGKHNRKIQVSLAKSATGKKYKVLLRHLSLADTAKEKIKEKIIEMTTPQNSALKQPTAEKKHLQLQFA